MVHRLGANVQSLWITLKSCCGDCCAASLWVVTSASNWMNFSENWRLSISILQTILIGLPKVPVQPTSRVSYAYTPIADGPPEPQELLEHRWTSLGVETQPATGTIDPQLLLLQAKQPLHPSMQEAEQIPRVPQNVNSGIVTDRESDHDNDAASNRLSPTPPPPVPSSPAPSEQSLTKRSEGGKMVQHSTAQINELTVAEAREPRKQKVKRPPGFKRTILAPDLPIIYSDTIAWKQNHILDKIRVVPKSPEEPLSDGLQVSLHVADRNDPAVDFLYQPAQKVVGQISLSYKLLYKSSFLQAHFEEPIMEAIAKSVRSKFYKGKPLHHLNSAKSIKLKNVGSNPLSQIYVTSEEDFNKLSVKEVQGIFRHRHILIPASKERTTPFNRKELSCLGNVDSPREIQGQFLQCLFVCFFTNRSEVNSERTLENPGNMLQYLTLKDLLPVEDGPRRPALNALELPMGNANIPQPPQYL
jgi:hypothetical protein